MSLNLYPHLKDLGKGGFGITYLATNTLLPTRPKCVVKKLIPTSNDPRLEQLLQDRFKQEAITLENLSKGSNGKIPTLYHYFVEQSEFYLVQEYIDGQTLTEKVLKQGQFTETQVRQILNDLLVTLSYVHQKGIIHRDIKPDNIMVRYSDDKSVLIDFGAVKEIMSTVMSGSENTGRSIFIGTPGFMPVEQMSGRPMFASDIYALGMTAIYLLTGRMPQEIETDPNTGNIKWQIYAPNVSPQLLEVLNKSIQPVPNHRYNNAQVMLQDLNGSVATQSPIEQNQTVATTVVAPMPRSYQEQVYTPPAKQYQEQYSSNNQSGNNPRTNPMVAAMIGVILEGGLIAGGLVLGKNFTSSDSTKITPSKDNPVSSTPNTNSQPSPIPSSIPSPRSSISPISSLINSIGWLRIGSVDTKDGQISVGQQLIRTTQPVTISPSRVPAIGDRITVINGVNLRVNSPQPPNYSLPQQKAAIPAGQELVIINTNAFIDPTSSSPYTAVWAEVGVK